MLVSMSVAEEREELGEADRERKLRPVEPPESRRGRKSSLKGLTLQPPVFVLYSSWA